MDLDRRLGLLDGMYSRANCAHHLSYTCPLERNSNNCVLVRRGMLVCPPKSLLFGIFGVAILNIVDWKVWHCNKWVV